LQFTKRIAHLGQQRLAAALDSRAAVASRGRLSLRKLWLQVRPSVAATLDSPKHRFLRAASSEGAKAQQRTARNIARLSLLAKELGSACAAATVLMVQTAAALYENRLRHAVSHAQPSVAGAGRARARD
jgi:hypothetical protein